MALGNLDSLFDLRQNCGMLVMFKQRNNEGHNMTMQKIPANHDLFEELSDLQARNLTITEAIHALNDLFLSKYDLDPYHINCGDCEYYADCLACIVPDCNGYWGDELTGDDDDHDRYAYHYFTGHGDKYYDSQTPEGIEDFREMPAFI